jgi:hypothetical protein
MDNETINIKIGNKTNDKNNNANQRNYIILYKCFIVINFILTCILLVIIYKLFELKYKYYLENKNDLKNILEICQNLKNEHQNFAISDKIKLLKEMTNNNELEYKGLKTCLENDPDSQHCIYHLITPKEVFGKKRIILGNKDDGCYVLLDDFNNIKIAYSFGIGLKIQFDTELANRDIDVYMYDHTINSLPYQNPKFHWKKIGIAGKKTKNKQMKTLEEIIIENGHSLEKNMILKMDVEYYEWESIIDLKEDTLNQFKYIAIEYHFKDEKIYNQTQLYYEVLKKISKTHQAFYVRCNGDKSKKINFGYNRICKIMEVSYIIKKDNIFLKDESIYPMYEFDYIMPKTEKIDMNLNVLKLFT